MHPDTKEYNDAQVPSDRVIFPSRKAPELLRAKWLASKLQAPSGVKIIVH